MIWQRKFMLALGSSFFLMSAVQILRLLGQPTDIWWTPRALALPLAEASDRVEVYVRDVALQRLLETGRVQMTSDAGATQVTESEVRLRLNNRDRIRAEQVPYLLGSGVVLGGSGVLVLIGLLWRSSPAPRRPD